MTDQEIFNKVAEHLLAQNEVSRIPEGTSCAYRGTGGMKCAVGILISDSEYTYNLEHESSTATVVKKALRKSGVIFTDTTSNLLRALQLIHDTTAPQYWEELLKIEAKKFNLRWELDND